MMQKASIHGLDLRSIGLFRIAIGLTLLLDVLIFKLPNIGDLYSPAGFFEDFYRTQALDARPFYLNLFYHLGSGPGIYLFFIGCGVVYLALAVGYRPRLLAGISFLLSSSTAASNSLMILGPDVLLLIALFWGMFLPLDARFCLPRRKQILADNQCRSLPAFLFLAVIGLVYFRNGYGKLGGVWGSGEALRYWVDLPVTRGVAGAWLADQHYGLLMALEYLTIIFEIGLLVVIFFPFFNRSLRLLTAASIILFHYGNLLFLLPGYYCVIGTCFAILLLPDTFWNKLSPVLKGTDHSPAPKSHPPARSALGSYCSISKNIVLLLCFCTVLAVNLAGLPRKIHKSFQQPDLDLAISRNHQKLESNIPQVALFSFMFVRHVYYESTIPALKYNIIALGTTRDGKIVNIVTGKYRADGSDLARHPPYFRRPYTAVLRGIFFNRETFARHKVAERWLETMTRTWNSAHPERTVIESVLLHATFKSSDVPIRPERITVVAEWKPGDP